jgi:hypothetical protein
MDCFWIGKIVSNNPHSAHRFFNFYLYLCNRKKKQKTVYLWMLFGMLQSIVMDEKNVITTSYSGEIFMKK